MPDPTRLAMQPVLPRRRLPLPLPVFVALAFGLTYGIPLYIGAAAVYESWWPPAITVAVWVAFVVAAGAVVWAQLRAVRKRPMGRKLVRSWYRSLTPDGRVWCETRDPAEVQRETHPELPLTYERLDVYEVSDLNWQPWRPGPGGDPS